MAPAPAANPIIQLIPILFMFVVFYFLLIRPQQKKQKEHEKLIKTLDKNDEVVTAAGIHCTIINVKEKTFVVRIDDNAKMEIDKSAVLFVTKKQS